MNFRTVSLLRSIGQPLVYRPPGYSKSTKCTGAKLCVLLGKGRLRPQQTRPDDPLEGLSDSEGRNVKYLGSALSKTFKLPK